jgi:hypothetical protein
VSEFDFSLVRLIFVAEERVFTLVLIAPLQVCSKVFYLSNTVLIAPLQSPWSSVTQGPSLGQFLSDRAISKPNWDVMRCQIAHPMAIECHMS